MGAFRGSCECAQKLIPTNEQEQAHWTVASTGKLDCGINRQIGLWHQQAHWTVALTGTLDCGINTSLLPDIQALCSLHFIFLPFLITRLGKVINFIPHFPSN
jgi:hypothetical protein